MRQSRVESSETGRAVPARFGVTAGAHVTPGPSPPREKFLHDYCLPMTTFGKLYEMFLLRRSLKQVQNQSLGYLDRQLWETKTRTLLDGLTCTAFSF